MVVTVSPVSLKSIFPDAGVIIISSATY
jgi:hypothetical protein